MSNENQQTPNIQWGDNANLHLPDNSDKRRLKYLKVIFVFSIILVCIFVVYQIRNGANQYTNNLSAPYVDSQGRYSINPPDGWIIAPETRGISTGIIISPKQKNSGITIVDPLPVNVSTAKEAATSLKAQAGQNPQYSLISEEPTTISGEDAYQFEFTYSDNGILKRSRTIVIQANHLFYTIMMIAPNSDWEKFNGIATKSVATFTIK